MQIRSAAAMALLCASFASAHAETDKYNITEAEHQACDTDAANLCSHNVSEDGVIACMKLKRAQLTPICLATFNAGLKRRHMPL